MPSIRPDILCAAALTAWLLTACVTDVRSRRIPNWLVASGMLAALALHAMAPRGDGLFAFWWGGLGVVSCLLGLVAGLVLFLPLYLLRAVGAGDAKLMAMVGAWLGPWLLLPALLGTLLAGGLLSLGAMLVTRTSRRVIANVRVMLTSVVVSAYGGKLAPLDAPAAHGVRVPYAIAIAVGTLGEVAWLLLRSGP
jgi:prepilin peptidase CpaA